MNYVELRNLEASFIELLTSYFKQDGFLVLQYTSPPVHGTQPDLLLQAPNNGDRIVIELKFSRTNYSTRGILQNALMHLNSIIRKCSANRGILVITQPMLPMRYIDTDHKPIEIWDLEVLINKMSPYPVMFQRLNDLIRTMNSGVASPPTPPERISSPIPENALNLTGTKLAEKLRKSQAGRKNKASAIFESLCEEALTLIYGEAFGAFKKQSPIEKGYHRLDLIARLTPAPNSFWGTIAQDFRTRYIIFEFKNYSTMITQDEIHSTERYLYVAALRSVAIIVARKGASESAKRAMRGALREQGKLIICISLDELCKLLEGFDVGDEPTNLLVEKLDEMLITIAR